MMTEAEFSDNDKRCQIEQLSPERQRRMATLALMGFTFERGPVYWTVYTYDGMRNNIVAWEALPAAIDKAWEFATEEPQH